MRALRVIVALATLGLFPAPAVPAASLDGSKPVLCALSSVVECSRRGDCQRSNAEDADVPPFVVFNFPQKVLSTLDGARTSPFTTVNRANGRMMIQGVQNERVWGAVINEETGQMSATVGEDDGAIVISGACTVR